MTQAMTVQNKKNIRKNRKGFTLIELIVVIAILAILAAIAIPAFTGTQKKAQQRVHDANVQILTSAARIAVAELGPTDAAALDWEGTDNEKDVNDYVDSWPDYPFSNATYVVTVDDTSGEVSVAPNTGDYDVPNPTPNP